MDPAVQFEPLSEDTLLLRFGSRIDVAVNARVQAAARRIMHALPDVECVPAYASLALRFDPARWRGDGAATTHAQLEAALRALLSAPAAPMASARTVTIPVCYGGAYGPDLDVVAAATGLDASAVIARHAAARYTVAMLGFAPGFPYLLGLDPALAAPRRADPRQHVPAGSVAIGGAQTGIYPDELPGGWQLIGRTPLRLFDVGAKPPCPLAPGDHVRFQPIDAAAFDALAARPPPCA